MNYNFDKTKEEGQMQRELKNKENYRDLQQKEIKKLKEKEKMDLHILRVQNNMHLTKIQLDLERKRIYDEHKKEMEMIEN